MLTQTDDVLLADILEDYIPVYLAENRVAQFAALSYYAKNRRAGSDVLRLLTKLAITLNNSDIKEPTITIATKRHELAQIFTRYEDFYDWAITRYYAWTNQDMMCLYLGLHLLLNKRRVFIARTEALNTINEFMVKLYAQDEEHVCPACSTPAINGEKCLFCGYKDR